MIDLHMHTNHSDGTDTVEELLKNAENSNLEIISITDHDSIDAYYELKKYPEIRKLYKGIIITGTELKTYFDDISIEVLAYGCDYEKLNIHKVDTKTLQEANIESFRKVLDREGFKYDPDELYIDLSNPTKHYAGDVVGREIKRYPENDELVKKFGEFTPEIFFRVHQCNKNSVFYINECKHYLGLEETIERIHEAGGLAFLAHGYIYPFEDKDAAIEKILRTTDIDGIECEYPLFSQEQREKAKELVKKYNKFMSGGSDYHAKAKPNTKLGTGIDNNLNVPKELIDNWIDKVRKV